jgi:hypothetical protein
MPHLSLFATVSPIAIAAGRKPFASDIAPALVGESDWLYRVS